MLGYLARRLLSALVVLLALSVATRAVLNAMPGDPLDALRRSRPMSSEDLERLKKQYGLGEPFPTQYARWLARAARGDLGHSRTHRVPVSDLLGPALRRTLLLTGTAFLLAAFVAVPLGARSALAPGSADDFLIRSLCSLGISVPTFWLCLVAIQLFAVRWRWFPPDAQWLPGEGGGLAGVNALALPVLIVAAQLVAEWARYVRGGLRDVLGADFLQAARARGASEARVLWVHALPNALVPFLTVLGLSLPYLVSGELVVEMVFGWPGLGQLEYNAIREQDHNVAMAALLLIAAVTVLGSLAADLAHARLDPRARSRKPDPQI